MNKSLHEMFVKKLNELYFIEQELVKALPKMASAASDEKLIAGFEEHLEQTRNHAERLETIMKDLGEEAVAEPNKVIEAMLSEGEKLMAMDLEADVKDAVLIAAAQVVEHLEIAKYGAVAAWAKAMEHDNATDLLAETLEEEKETDKKLSGIAEGGILTKGLNEEAVE